MKQRSKASGKVGKPRRRKTATPKPAIPPKAVPGRRSKATTQEPETSRLTRERDEALEREKATAEVLRVISSSAGQLEPIFQAMLENAVRICGANFGVLFLREGDALRRMAAHNPPAAYVEEHRRAPLVRPSAASAHGRLIATKRVVHIADLRADQAYRDAAPTTVLLVEAAGARSYLGVPMLKDDELIGTIIIYRQEIRPFTDKQIELLQNFAAQAVIAIENARLLNELRQRTDDLTELLQQQTATSEILDVISNSPTDSQPAFDAIVRSGLKLFPDAAIMIALPEGDKVKSAAVADADPAGAEALRARTPLPLSREFITSAAILDRREVDLPDAREAPAELAVGARNFLASGYRAITVIPMMRRELAIGALDLMRRRPGPLSDKQRELLRTFARQAVIAIENTRLFNELRQRTTDLTESLEQQTGTSEVLKVISSSAGELRPVFDTMLAKAVALCEASFGAMWLVDGEGYRTAALHGDLPEAYVEQWRSGTLHHPKAVVPMVRANRSRKPVHVSDMLKDKAYLERRSASGECGRNRRHPDVGHCPDAQGRRGDRKYHYLPQGGLPLHRQAD